MITGLIPIYLMKLNEEDWNEVVQAEFYIIEKTNEYILEERNGVHTYTVLKDGVTIFFSINNYDAKAAGLSGTYEDFYEYKNGDIINIISPNKEKLKGFCGWINRLTH